jgi:hypothetical protein
MTDDTSASSRVPSLSAPGTSHDTSPRSPAPLLPKQNDVNEADTTIGHSPIGDLGLPGTPYPSVFPPATSALQGSSCAFGPVLLEM